MYKTEILNRTTNIKVRAQKIEERANLMEKEGFDLISVLATPNFGAIMIFKKRENRIIKL